jgi:hypothetical protein
MDKVSFQDAAKQAGVHFNTVKNWRKAGKFKTAEKVIENGRELWLVDPAEVIQVARQSKQGLSEIQDNVHVHIDGTNIDNDRSDVYTTQTKAPPSSQSISTSQALEQNLTLIRESIVRPLVEANERQAVRLEEMARENERLKERVKQLEAGQAAPVVVEKRKGFWSRLFSGE